MSKTISIGKWELSEDLVMRYMKLIQATENSPGTRYNYEFDEQRKECHQKLLDAAGVDPAYYSEYCEFTKALRKFEESVFPSEEVHIPAGTKLTAPPRGFR